MTTAYKIILSASVARELEAIFRHISKDSPDNAAAMIGRLLDSIEGLKAIPHRTVVSGQGPRVRHPVRSLPVPPFVIYFRADDAQQVVRILTVRHGARRRPKRFG